MSPESKCYDCKKVLCESTQEELIEQELNHHIESKRRGFHSCFWFKVYDEGGARVIGHRIYKQGRLWEESILKPIS